MDHHTANALYTFAVGNIMVVAVGCCVLWGARRWTASERRRVRIVFWSVVVGCLLSGLGYFVLQPVWHEFEVLAWLSIGFWSSLGLGSLLKLCVARQPERNDESR